MRYPVALPNMAAVAASFFLAPPVYAADTPGGDQSFNASLALRVFNNRVGVTGNVPTGIPGVDPVSASSSASATTYIPSLALRYGRWVASASYFTNTEYSSFTPELNRSFRFERREWDANVGYAVLPALIVTVGYKELKASGLGDNPVLTTKFSGPTVGLAASAPLTPDGPLSLYGNLAIGRLKQTVGGAGYPRGDYVSGEFGLQYSLRNLSSALGRTSVLLAYRSQAIRAKGVPTAVFDATPTGGAFRNSERDVKDTSDGFLIGLNVVF